MFSTLVTFVVLKKKWLLVATVHPTFTFVLSINGLLFTAQMPFFIFLFISHSWTNLANQVLRSADQILALMNDVINHWKYAREP